MPSHVHKRGATAPEMNLTPMIDVVFQLIIFFMLVNNVIANEFVRMVVPDLEDPKTQQMAEDNRIVISIAPREHSPSERAGNPLAFSGIAQYVQVGSQQRFSMGDLSGVTALLQDAREDNPELSVLLRADCALHYEEVQPVMTAITTAGIETINLVAYMPGEAPTAAPGAQPAPQSHLDPLDGDPSTAMKPGLRFAGDHRSP